MAFSLLFAINKQRQTQNTYKTLTIILFYFINVKTLFQLKSKKHHPKSIIKRAQLSLVL